VIFGAAAYVKAVVALQDVLGEHQDAVVVETWLRSRVAGATAEQAFALGLLTAVQRERQRRTRAQWPAVWAAADRRRLRWWRQ
jgi:CHAD domain-containing protein